MKVLALLSLVGACGCAVSHPPGWPERREPPVVVAATPWVMYGFAPLSWDLPDGRVIHVEVERCSVGSTLGGRSVDIDFSAAFRGQPDRRIRCRTDPRGEGVPETRFGCWSEGETGTPVALWMAPELECSGSDHGTLTRASCWDGQGSRGEEPISLVHGLLESTGSPVGYVSWVSRQGPLLAANIVVDQQVRLYDVGAELSPDLRDRLVLLTVALSWWEHASRSD